jgi:gluconokinase
MGTSKIVVMGVSVSGKSLVGERLAEMLGFPFFDADDFHSAANVEKMARGVPLDDADRAGWLEDLSALIRRESTLVLGCSALKRAYRDRLRHADAGLVFLYMAGDFETIRARLASRQGHYFTGDAMLLSQFEQLEPPGPDEAHAIDIRLDPAAVLVQCLSVLK